jgi:hypothetical protein
MENISQKPPAPRGRPRLSSTEFEDVATRFWAFGKTRHTRTNAVYRHRAIRQFIEDARFAWLCRDPVPNGPDGTLRRTILTELGRIDDEGIREAIALDLCARQPTAREAVAQIRAYRLGRSPRGSVRQLYLALARTLQDYVVAHPDMPWEAVQEAVVALRVQVNSLAGQDETRL